MGPDRKDLRHSLGLRRNVHRPLANAPNCKAKSKKCHDPRLVGVASTCARRPCPILLQPSVTAGFSEVLQHCAGLSHENVEAFEVKHVIFKGMDGMEAGCSGCSASQD